MRYGNWENLNPLSDNVPATPGLFQIKKERGLLDYPSGKTAMFYYGYANNLKTGLVEFRDKVLPQLDAPQEVVVRWMETQEIRKKFEKQMYLFHAKFGCLPLGNERLLQKNEN